MKGEFKNIILENQAAKTRKYIERFIEIPVDLDIIVSIIGSRRSGKTYLLYSIIDKLKNQGVRKENILFINFEDERLSLQTKDLDLLLQAYQELYPDTELNEVYFFFDEIQNINGWEKFVRRIFDTKSKKIFITGSNAKLLSTDIATELRGRTISYTIYPFSFAEYMLPMNAPKNIHTQANRSKVIHLVQQFLFNGGFPELIDFDDQARLKVLQQYFNVMIYRDIVERYRISNPELLKFVIKKIFSSVTGTLSINKMYYDLKSMGYKISNKYLYQYEEYCNAVFLIRSIPKFDYSEIKRSKSEKKTYVIDNGLITAIDFKHSENRGILFENMVAMEFLKQEKDIFYFKKNYECDFIVSDRGAYSAFQVSYSILDSNTRKREFRGLKYACSYMNLLKGTVITFDEEGQYNFDGIDIAVVPFYKMFGGF